MIRAENACIIPVTLHLKGILLGNRGLGLLAIFFLVVCATKCQMFAFLMRVRHWRGWMHGSRTMPELRSAETFSAHLTERRYGGIWRPRYRKVCRSLERSTISIPSTTGRSLRTITSGRRSATHRSFITDRLTGAKDPSEMRTRPAIPERMLRIAKHPQTAREKDVREIQVIYLDCYGMFLFHRAARQGRGATVVSGLQP